MNKIDNEASNAKLKNYYYEVQHQQHQQMIFEVVLDDNHNKI